MLLHPLCRLSAAATISFAVGCASHVPDPGEVAQRIRAAVSTTASAATVRATAHVRIAFQPSSYELTGTVDRTAAGFSFTGSETIYSVARPRTAKVRVVGLGGRFYADSTLLPHGSRGRPLSPDRATPITGSPTVDLSVLDPWLYLNVMNPAYWTDSEGIGEPEDKGIERVGGVQVRHYLTGCGSVTDMPNCDWAKLGSLFRYWHGAISGASEDAWVYPNGRGIRRVTARWNLNSIQDIPIDVETTLDLAALPTPVEITAPRS